MHIKISDTQLDLFISLVREKMEDTERRKKNYMKDYYVEEDFHTARFDLIIGEAKDQLKELTTLRAFMKTMDAFDENICLELTGPETNEIMGLIRLHLFELGDQLEQAREGRLFKSVEVIEGHIAKWKSVEEALGKKITA